ncbi:prephenate dehydrogenase/arogenate dehydrogenase family protein [Natrialba sp. INN-245]|uniref:prephenate dehydrogenase/arogenate dehydrogenase family protein n=1 Tax=Natrialba sp. INN-245 TaxID=2690967 RepID=UPI00130F9C1C|nr:prephenate dehydrogenase/arogenate dehydrogenase family protein [Natrialba sp. INN-245]MWV39357.1 prephenate dehydrogenase/arogenate dehydrogenase family protein [Natrialba sp. INN-245]
MDVLIVGAGSMGTWFGGAIDDPVAFADVDADAAGAAADAVGGTVADLDGDSRYDVVCLAVPMAHVADAVAEHAPRAKRALVDVSGVMGPPLEAMAEHAPDSERLSLHPLFAPERAPGSIAVVSDRSGPTTDTLLEALAERGNDLLETTATEHDEAMETVQASAHAAVLSFALAAESVPDGFETPVYEQLRALAQQVTAGTPRVYADIQYTFDGADAVADAASEIATADHGELEVLYREASSRWHDGEPLDGEDGSTDDEDGSTDEPTVGETE